MVFAAATTCRDRPPLSALLHRRRRPTPLRIDAPSRRGSVNYMVDHICEPMPSTGSHLPNYAARCKMGKDTAYSSVICLAALISARCITIRSHIAPRWHTREAADPAPFVTRQMRR